MLMGLWFAAEQTSVFVCDPEGPLPGGSITATATAVATATATAFAQAIASASVQCLAGVESILLQTAVLCSRLGVVKGLFCSNLLSNAAPYRPYNKPRCKIQPPLNCSMPI